ncbi:MAG: winged helix-turn-helix transcriptional regulator [Planctomycetota bacterium]|nr:winged helix-turn-helix transcriptional regulator [Planctomycetota bacterium]MDA1178046.1 winged helix-turn-helix transcriptional regulator [Planctomycetota bacterium]
MANQLGMDKTLAIKQLRQSGMSQQSIASALGISRGSVKRHLARLSSNGTEAPTGQAPTGSYASNSTEAPTGSDNPPAPALPSLRIGMHRNFRQACRKDTALQMTSWEGMSNPDFFYS